MMRIKNSAPIAPQNLWGTGTAVYRTGQPCNNEHMVHQLHAWRDRHNHHLLSKKVIVTEFLMVVNRDKRFTR